MLLWVILAAMTAAAIAAVLRPLRRDAGLDQPADAPVIAVYRDQLAEIDAERERGLMTPQEASAARLEVQRRLLSQAGDAAAAQPVDCPPASSRRPAWTLMIAVPVLSIAAYAVLGSPGMPDQPLQQRRAAAPEKAQTEILIARVEERLRTHPEDGQGWEVIAPVYARLGRDQEALDAWRQAIKLLGPSTARLRGLAESSIGLGQGAIDAEARGALESLRAGNPDDPIPKFWLAMAKQQDGRRAEAVADLEALLAKAPADAPWRAAVAERLAEMKAAARPNGVPKSAAGPAASGAVPPGPSSEQIAAAQQMTPEDRARMISGMVDGLAARLAQNGADAEGWLRLVNAYMVLGRKTDAAAALASARKALAGDAPALTRLAGLARDLGL